MKLNEKTLAILKNFSTINPQILLTPGNSIRTQSGSDDLLAFATVKDTIPVTTGIHDLNRFIAVVSLFTDPDIDITEDRIIIKTDRQVVNFTTAPEGMIQKALKEDYEFPGPESVNISATDLSKTMKAATTLGHSEILFRGADGVVTLEGINTNNPTDNTYSLEVGKTEHTFKLLLNKDRMLMLPRDYRVTFTKDMGIEFTAEDVRYFVGYYNGTDVGTLNAG